MLFPLIIICIILAIVIILGRKKTNEKEILNIDLSEYKDFKTLKFNTYGEIHSLGMKYEKYEFDDEVLKEFMKNTYTYNNWKKLPLTKNLKVLLEDYIISSSANAEDSSRFKGYIDIPSYINGYYYFIDRNKNRENIDTTILSRQHLGFELFILNIDDKELNHIVMNY